MKSSLLKSLAVGGLFVVGALQSFDASAQCSIALPQFEVQQQSWRGDAPLPLMRVDWRHRGDDIVGFWNIVVTAKGNPTIPDGTVLDRGLQQWHDDGTEFLNSSAQHPLTQNYCLGTWEKTGPFTYKLNHFAYQYDTSQNVTGVARIREEVKVSRDGDEMTGTQVVDVYDNLRNHLATVKGVLVGKRITLDTTAQDIH